MTATQSDEGRQRLRAEGANRIREETPIYVGGRVRILVGERIDEGIHPLGGQPTRSGQSPGEGNRIEDGIGETSGRGVQIGKEGTIETGRENTVGRMHGLEGVITPDGDT
mmetsp:Transcript_22734/g.45733  ORF Transcript_22734/g.45733 Transcript_22734/m.45733 type:complete len:110 (+) Transcript_22734:3003-3332(+)